MDKIELTKQDMEDISRHIKRAYVLTYLRLRFSGASHFAGLTSILAKRAAIKAERGSR